MKMLKINLEMSNRGERRRASARQRLVKGIVRLG